MYCNNTCALSIHKSSNVSGEVGGSLYVMAG